MHEVEYRQIRILALPPCLFHRSRDEVLVLLRRTMHEVRAVHRQAHRDLGERPAQRIERVVARAAVRARESHQLGRQHVELRRQRSANHIALADMRERLEVRVDTTEIAPDALEFACGRGIDQHAVGDVGKAVAGGAVHMPALRNFFVGRGDLLGDDIERTGRATLCIDIGQGQAGTPCIALLQLQEVARRVVQAIGMVDAQAVDHAGRSQVECERLRGLEDFVALHAQCGQIVDVEEAPVVDLVCCDAPVSQAVGLRFDQRVQRVARVFMVERVDRCGNRFCQRRRAGAQPCQPGLQQFLVARALGPRLWLGFVAARQMTEGRRDTGRSGGDVGIFDLPRCMQQHVGVALWRQWKAVFEVVEREAAFGGVEAQRDLAVLQHLAVMAAQHRQQHLAGEFDVERLPVDVEVLREVRRLAVLQHVEPPRVVGAQHTHVVGHHVEELTEPVLPQGADEAREALGPADLRIDLVVRHHVVAVHAAGPRALDRRAIHMAHAQLRQVREDAHRIVEAEVLVELQAVGRPRHTRLHAARRSRTRATGRAWSHTRHRVEKTSCVALGTDGIEIDRQLAAPVRLLVGGAGQVCLLDRTQCIFELHQHQRRRRHRQIQMNGLHRECRQGLAAGGFGHLLACEQAGMLHGQQQAHALLRTIEQLLLEGLLVRKQAELPAQAQVVARPPARQRGQVVRAHGHQRMARVLARGLEITVGPALEIQEAVRMNLGAGQCRAHLVGHGAEVFTDHHAMVALALQCDDGHHLVQRVVHVGAIACAMAFGHPEQTHQTHHMVDAQRARAAHVGTQGLDEDAVAAGTQMVRPQRRQAPALPVGIELVRRCADAGTGTEGGRLAPHVRAAAVDRHRQVEEQADAEPERLAPRVHPNQLLDGDPLQVEVIEHAIGVCICKGGDLGRSRIAIGLGPHRPAPDGAIDQMKVRLQRLEQRVPAQRLAALFDEGEESFAPRAARFGRSALAIGRQVLRTEMREQEFQHFELGGGHAGVVDQRRCTQIGQARLEAGRANQPPRGIAGIELVDRLHVDVQHVDLLARRRAVRAGMRRVVREQRMQRAQADDVGAALGHDADQLRQIAEIADAPVVLRAQRIELHRRAPDATVALCCRRSMAMFGGTDDECRGADIRLDVHYVSAMRCGVTLDAEAVVARRQTQRHCQATFVPTGAVQFCIGGVRQRTRIDLAAVHRTVFFVEPPTHKVRCRRQAQRDGPLGGTGLHGQHRRQRFRPIAAQGRVERGGGIERVVEHHAELGEQAHQMFACDAMVIAPDVVVVGRDTEVRAEALHGLDVAVRAGVRHSKAPRG